jgi:hypothetical protein
MQSFVMLIKRSSVLFGILMVVAAVTLSGCANSSSPSGSSDDFRTCSSCMRTASCSAGHCPYATTLVSESDGEFSPAYTMTIPAQIDTQPLAKPVMPRLHDKGPFAESRAKRGLDYDNSGVLNDA